METERKILLNNHAPMSFNKELEVQLGLKDETALKAWVGERKA
jgi:hypothetical protein